MDFGGKVFVVTGANSGIGFEAAKVFAAGGASVVLACRSVKKGDEARASIVDAQPSADVEVVGLDLAELASVKRFADAMRARHRAIDVLCNNAGVMAIPRRTTADGFEMQLGTNHLGHFALTGRLLDLLEASGDARVITVSSMVHRVGKIRFDDLQGERRYDKWGAYGASKLANLLFAYELARRVERAGKPITSLAVHPGYAATNLQAVGPTMEGSSLMLSINNLGNKVMAQDAAAGALPTIHAATDSSVKNGEYYGPDGLFGMTGKPAKATSSSRSHDTAVAAKLWDVSQSLTGVRYL
jgi:NAD(P)-dependent dehydrogenase (short-subunit alcohol dehydrogenase family)